MTDTLKMNTYFRPGITSLDRLQREKERVQSCADRNAAHYASIIRALDEEIAAVKAQEALDTSGAKSR